MIPPKITLLLDHDTSLNLSRDDFFDYKECSKGKLFAIRKDKELTVTYKHDPFLLWFDPIEYSNDFEQWLRIHEGVREIVTNRLHSAIIGTILGKKITLLPNNYHKNRSVWEFSLKEMGVKWQDSIVQNNLIKYFMSSNLYKLACNSYKLKRFIVGRYLRSISLDIMGSSSIPNVIHFIFGLQDGGSFDFMHYLAIKSAHDCNKPEAIKFYYKYEPTGEWWEKSKPYLTLIKVEPPTEIFGNKIFHPAHQADVIRLETLIKEGGIYLDMDVVCFNSFRPLLRHNCVLGREGWVGLCNAVILARPGARFLKNWYSHYRNFDSTKWNEHSVRLPLQLAKENPEDIHIEDRYAFFWPLYDNPEALWDEPEQRKTFKSKVKHMAEGAVLSQSYP